MAPIAKTLPRDIRDALAASLRKARARLDAIPASGAREQLDEELEHAARWLAGEEGVLGDLVGGPRPALHGVGGQAARQAAEEIGGVLLTVSMAAELAGVPDVEAAVRHALDLPPAVDVRRDLQVSRMSDDQLAHVRAISRALGAATAGAYDAVTGTYTVRFFGAAEGVEHLRALEGTPAWFARLLRHVDAQEDEIRALRARLRQRERAGSEG